MDNPYVFDDTETRRRLDTGELYTDFGPGREVLDAETQRGERVLLETRIADGLPIEVLSDAERRAVPDLIADGLIDGRAALGASASVPRVVPTLRGRLLADTVVHRLLGR